MIKQTENNGFKAIEFTFGDGDIFISGIGKDKNHPIGLILMDFPDKGHKVNDSADEVIGEDCSCLGTIGTKLIFKSKADIDFFIADLQNLREAFQPDPSEVETEIVAGLV